MFVTDCVYSDIVRMQHVHRYVLMNDDGTYYNQAAVMSDDKLSLDEMMMKFNESNIWFIAPEYKFGSGYESYIQRCVKLVDEMKNNPAYSNLFDNQARRLRRMQIEQHKAAIRAEAMNFETDRQFMYTQKDKTKFRTSKKWRDFRDKKRKEQKVDPITGAKLTRMANLHHKDLDEEHYEDISNEDNFVFLNKKTHDVVHFFFLKSKPTEWRKRVLALIKILKEMENINSRENEKTQIINIEWKKNKPNGGYNHDKTGNV